jgi:peroxiredoxin Q/BCP
VIKPDSGGTVTTEPVEPETALRSPPNHDTCSQSATTLRRSNCKTSTARRSNSPDTPGCTTEACGFRDSWEAFAERDVPVFGISDDTVEDLDDFAEKYDLPFTLLSDPDGEVASKYDSYGEKNMFGKTFDGTFRNTFVVHDGDIVAVFDGVSPDGHAEEVLAELP